MKDFEDLNTFEKVVLLACCKANNFSLKSHVPIGFIRKKIGKGQHKYVKRAVKTLVSSGFIIKQPTGGNTTYKLSPDGLKAGNILKDEI